MEDFRKLLLVYRLIHFKDAIPDLDIGVIGRDKELVKPTLQLFQGTETQDRLIESFQTILDFKNKRKATSIQSSLLDVAASIIPDLDQDVPSLDGKVEILAKDFWLKIPDRISGQQDNNKPGEYHSVEFGTLYKGTVGKILHENFGIESYHTRDGNMLVLHRHIIRRLRSQLNGKISISVSVNTVNTVKADRGGGYNDSERETSFSSEIIERENMTPLPQLPSQPSQA